MQRVETHVYDNEYIQLWSDSRNQNDWLDIIWVIRQNVLFSGNINKLLNYPLEYLWQKHYNDITTLTCNSLIILEKLNYCRKVTYLISQLWVRGWCLRPFEFHPGWLVKASAFWCYRHEATKTSHHAFGNTTGCHKHYEWNWVGITALKKLAVVYACKFLRAYYRPFF